MVTHRIRELRERRGWSQELLASKIQRTKSVISRIEDGITRLDLETAKKIADAFDATLAEVLGIEVEPASALGFAEEFVPYKLAADDKLAALVGENEYAFQVDTDALDKAGIHRGDIVIIDDSTTACKNPAPLQPVRVRYHPPENYSKPVTLLLQYVPPSLLITNSSSGARMPLDMDRDDAHIIGVVKRVDRRYA